MSDQGEPTGRHLKPIAARESAMVQYDPYQANASAEEELIDIMELWRSVAKRKWVVISILAIFMVTGVLSVWLTVPVYRATAVVQINHETANILRIEDFEAAPRSWQGVEQFYQTQYEILRGRQLAENVVRRLEVWDHPELSGVIRQRSLMGELRALPQRVKAIFGGRAQENSNRREPDSEQQREVAIRRAGAFLRSKIQVTPREFSRLVNVSVSSFDPSFAATLANAVVEEYVRSTMQRRFDAGEDAREFLQSQLSDMRIALERADQDMIDFAQANGVADLQERIRMANDALRGLNTRLAEAEANLVQLGAFRSLIDNGQATSIRPVVNDTPIQSLEQQKAALSTELASLSQRFMDDYPAIVELRSQMAEIDSQITDREQAIIQDVLAEYRNLQAEVSALEAAIQEREAGILQLSQQGVQYNILMREVETNRDLYNGMLQRLREIGIAAGAQENNIAMIDSALRPGRPYLPNVQRTLLMALALGLAAGIGLALVLEFLDTSVRRIEDVERMVGRPVLGLIPMVKIRQQKQRIAGIKKAQDRAVSHYSELHPKSAVSEAFRSLRTSLMFSTPQGMPKTILMTSPGPGDGKTTNAINLATVMAQNGSKVLIIDADLRKPRLHRDFGIPHSPGLTNRIASLKASENSSSSAIVPTTVDGLFVMPSGNHAPNPAELLSSDRMQKIIDMASRAFDHVIIDTAPVLGLADALVLSRCVDGVILVVGCGATTKVSVKTSTHRLSQVQAPLLGVVMNQVDMDSPDYSYYSSYYYNYSAEEIEQDSHADADPKALSRSA
jgi:capsular exopolysaccharide synthesis family protein